MLISHGRWPPVHVRPPSRITAALTSPAALYVTRDEFGRSSDAFTVRLTNPDTAATWKVSVNASDALLVVEHPQGIPLGPGQDQEPAWENESHVRTRKCTRVCAHGCIYANVCVCGSRQSVHSHMSLSSTFV